MMKIVTVNITEEMVEGIAKLVGEEEDKLYPSRSELIRVYMKQYLINQIKSIESNKNHPKLIEEPPEPEIPYKIIKKLEDPNNSPEPKRTDFKHDKPKQFLKLTNEFNIDLLLSFIQEEPMISNEKLALRSKLDYRTVRSCILRAINEYKVPLNVKTGRHPDRRGKQWFYSFA